MLRRFTPSAVSSSLAAGSIIAGGAHRDYRIMPHIYNEIEELAETQKAGRWDISHRNSLGGPLKRAEHMCNKLNEREARRNGTMPEKSIARKLSMFYTNKDGTPHYANYRVKKIKFTVIGMDGHPFHFVMPPMPEYTINNIIASSGMNYGHSLYFNACDNEDCQDFNHGDGCLVNVDLETLDRLQPPNRYEYTQLSQFRGLDHPNITFNSRFSCQVAITEELDGAVFAQASPYTRGGRAMTTDTSNFDDLGLIAGHKSKRVEPWAPILEEPTVRDFSLGYDTLWCTSYQDFMAKKYPNYKRKDGFHSKPTTWCARV